MTVPRDATPRLVDIVEAIALIRDELSGIDFAAFERDRRKRWIAERGIEIVSEASRHLPDDLKARHPDIPWRKVAGIGNIFGSFVSGALRNPEAAPRVFGNVLLGFALTEAVALFALVIAFMILFVF